MYVIVVGAGKIGFYLTRALLSANHEVTLIDRDAHVSEVATEEFGSIVITSDGTEPAVLYDAGAARCDIFISILRRWVVSRRWPRSGAPWRQPPTRRLCGS
jgi:trk system potassium uptake protein TrkA